VGVAAAILNFQKCHRPKLYTPSCNCFLRCSSTYINCQKTMDSTSTSCWDFFLTITWP